MRTALRVLGRIACWVAIGVAVFFGAIAVGLLVAPDEPDARGGGVLLLVVALALAAGAVWGLRRTPKQRVLAVAARPGELEALQARVRAGEPVVLRPGRRRAVVLLIVSLVFAVGAGFGFAGSRQVILAAGVVLFGLGVVMWTLMLIPGRTYLRIAADGLLVHGPLKVQRYAWDVMATVSAYEIGNGYGTTRQVGFTRRDQPVRRRGVLRAMGRGMSGVDVALPDTYGLRNTELAELLAEAQARYGTVHGPTAEEIELAREAARVPHDRRPVATALITAICVAAFVWEVARYGLFPTGAELYDAGGAWGSGVASGRWWTLLTANVLHAGPVHLIFNLFAFVLLGWLLEREVGWARFGAFCVIAGVAAIGAAVLVQGDTGVVGLSGVIFAVAGWAVVRDRYGTRPLGTIGWSMLPAGLVYTFLVPNVSIACHLGGLLAGVVLGWAFERRPQPDAVAAA